MAEPTHNSTNRGMRGRILEMLKMKGGATAAALGAFLGISPVGVRQHLLLLERDGLVRHRPVRKGRGRPSHLFELTQVANEAFPQRYSELLLTLIEAVRETSGELGLASLFDRRTELQEQQYRSDLEGKKLEERVEALAGIRDAEGYMAEVAPDTDGGWILRERNCAIRAVADCCAEVCRAELELFEKVLPEAEVARLEHITSGDGSCVYRIRPKR